MITWQIFRINIYKAVCRHIYTMWLKPHLKTKKPEPQFSEYRIGEKIHRNVNNESYKGWNGADSFSFLAIFMHLPNFL